MSFLSLPRRKQTLGRTTLNPFWGLVIASVMVSGCQLKTRRALPGEGTTPVSQAPVSEQANLEKPEGPQSIPLPEAMVEPPKLGVILGPGAIRAYAHLGVLTELSKRKLPIHAVVGLETGALVAGLFAQKGQVYDAEWQMMKLKEEDWFERGLLISKKGPRAPSSLTPFLKEAFASRKIDQGTLPFACPSKKLGGQQILMMDRGSYQQSLPFCLGFPPVFASHQGSVAGVISLPESIQFLKAQGATHILFVNVLTGNPSGRDLDFSESVLWSVVGEALDKSFPQVDLVISVPVSDLGLKDFEKRNELIRRGQRAGQIGAVELEKILQN